MPTIGTPKVVKHTVRMRKHLKHVMISIRYKPTFTINHSADYSRAKEIN